MVRSLLITESWIAILTVTQVLVAEYLLSLILSVFIYPSLSPSYLLPTRSPTRCPDSFLYAFSSPFSRAPFSRFSICLMTICDRIQTHICMYIQMFSKEPHIHNVYNIAYGQLFFSPLLSLLST